MTREDNDNVVDLAKVRDANSARATAEERRRERRKETLDELETLRNTVRVPKEDQSKIVRNLGRIVAQIEPKDPMGFAKRVLGEDLFEKRKRYILFAGEQPADRYHATGKTFARFIDDLIKERIRRGFADTQAKIETIRDVLKGTSFRPWSRFEMQENGEDAAFFVDAVGKVLNRLVQECDLQEYFDRVSKYPVYDNSTDRNGKWNARELLYFHPNKAPNDLYEWNNFLEDEDEIQNWIPWWAPKCIVGHIYVPMDCNSLRLASKVVEHIKEVCGANISEDSWRGADCSWLEGLLLDAERTENGAYHRLPVWLMALPQPDRLIACFYTAFDSRMDEFQIKASLSSDNSYHAYDNASTPRFVKRIGERLESDEVFFSGDEISDDGDDTLFIHHSENEIELIGSRIQDDEILNFIPKAVGYLSDWEGLPAWLHPYPIQQIMKLTSDSPWPTRFALQPRLVPRGQGVLGVDFGGQYLSEAVNTIFRPMFPEHASNYAPPIAQNTIAACVLRGLVNEGEANLFSALCNDANAKHKALHSVVDSEIKKFQDEFGGRYEKQ